MIEPSISSGTTTIPRTGQSTRSHSMPCATAPAGARWRSPRRPAARRPARGGRRRRPRPGRRRGCRSSPARGCRAACAGRAARTRPTTARAPRAATGAASATVCSVPNVARSSGVANVLRRLRSDRTTTTVASTPTTTSAEQHQRAGRRRPSRYRPRAPTCTRRDSRRSASGLPPVWQPGQYWNDRSAKDTSRTVSPHTGQGSPVRACTRSPERFSPLSVAAPWPTDRSTASVSTARSAACRTSTCSGFSRPADRVRRQLRGVQDLVAVGVADPGDRRLVDDQGLDPLGAPGEQLAELVAGDARARPGRAGRCPGTCCGSATR